MALSLPLRSLLLPAALFSSLVIATPAATPRVEADAAKVAPRDPLVTPSAVVYFPSRTFHHRRDIFSDFKSDVNGLLSSLGDVPSYVASGVPNFFQDFPSGDDVQSSLGLDGDQVRALPTQVLNISPYANYTEQGWNVRFHGNVYKQPDTDEEKLNDLANIFLVGTDIEDLPQSQQEQARNLTAGIFVLQQGDVEVATIHLEPAPNQGASGEASGGGGTEATGGSQEVNLPYNTTDQGDFDVFVPIESNGLLSGNDTTTIQKLNTYVEGATLGNATAYLVPNEGLTVISDIDDILRVTKIYDPAEGLLNSFARPFRAWDDMPAVYANWSQSLSDIHFHYLTTTPEQVTRNYMQFIAATYPGGSFDTRPLNFSDVSATLSIRKFLLTKILETFPERKFVLVADTSNSDVMSAYPEMATTFPDAVQCIFLRNTSATDDTDKFPYDTSGFENLDQTKYMFFRTPSDLMGLDIGSGQCYNSSVPQNLTFGYQGLPLGIGDDAAVNGSAKGDDKNAGAGLSDRRLGWAFAAVLGAAFWQFL